MTMRPYEVNHGLRVVLSLMQSRLDGGHAGRVRCPPTFTLGVWQTRTSARSQILVSSNDEVLTIA